MTLNFLCVCDCYICSIWENENVQANWTHHNGVEDYKPQTQCIFEVIKCILLSVGYKIYNYGDS